MIVSGSGGGGSSNGVGDFDQIDANKDGKLTQDELRAYREAKRSGKDKS